MRVLLRDLTPGQDYLLQFRNNDGTSVSEWSPVYSFRTNGDATAPANPGNLQWKPTGESFLATWDAPTLDGNGKALKDLNYYEVTVKASGKTKVYTTTSTTWEFTLAMNAEAFGGIELTVEITVKSVDATNNKSSGVILSATEDTPPTPSTPIVTNTMGQLTVEWNGKTSLGTINPFNLSFVEIHASKTNNFTPADTTVVDRFEGWATGSQKKILTGLDYGVAYYFKLIAVNKKGKKSPASPQASGTAARISGLDIQNGAITVDQINFASQLGGGRAWYQTTEPTAQDGAKDGDIWFDTDDGYHPRVRAGGIFMEARDATIAAAAGVASTAQSTANGKNTVFYGTAAPSNTVNPGNRAGDIWFVRNATTGVITGQYEWSGTGWNPRTLDNAVIANLDAGKITAGTLDANRIAANTITADKLTVAAKSDDLVINGRFTDLNASSLPVAWGYDTGTGFAGATYGTTTTAADIGSGLRGLRLTNAANNAARIMSVGIVPAAAGEKIAMQAWVKGAAAYTGNAFTMWVYPFAADGSLAPGQIAYTGPLTTTPTLYSGSVTLPANTKQILFAVVLESNAASRSIYISDLQARRQVGAVMIADGAVTASKINAGAVTADAIGANLIITAAANIGTAVIDSASIASIDAAKITTGVLQSSTSVNYNGITKPLWSIDMTGMAVFNEAHIIGQLVVGNANAATVADNSKAVVRSYNYIPNSAGWTINGDGTVEFGNAVMRGSFATSNIGRRVEVLGDAANSSSYIRFIGATETAKSYIQGGTSSLPIAGTEILAMKIPVTGTYGAWNSIQIQSNESMYTFSKNVVLTYGGTTTGGEFRIEHATDKGTINSAPQLDTRLWINETNGTLMYDNGNRLRLWLSNDGGFQVYDGSDANPEGGDLRIIVADDYTTIYNPAGPNNAVNGQGQIEVQRTQTIIRGNPNAAGDTSMLSVLNSGGVAGNSARLSFINRASQGGLIKYYNAAGDAVGQRFEFRNVFDTIDIPIRASAYLGPSDPSTKEHIRDLEFEPLEAVRSMVPRQFKRKDSHGSNGEVIPGEEQVGFMVGEVPIQVVHGDPVNTTDAAIDLMSMIATAVGAIKKVDENLVALESKFDKIEARLTALEKNKK